METTSYGYGIPEALDLASVWMQALADNWERISDHDHDGVDSPALTAAALSKFTSTITSGSWSAGSGGMYSQTITVPAAVLEFNSFDIYVYVTSTGERIYPGIVRASATTWTITVNDNSLNLTAKYG
jgi:hypothetical protein